MSYLRPLGGDGYQDPVIDPIKLAFDEGYWKQVTQQQSDAACQKAANKATVDLTAATLDLSRSWRPTGFYSVADFEAMLQKTWDILNGAGKALDQILADDFAIKDGARMERNAITNRYGESMVFVRAMNEAKAKNITVIDAPGFKRWVIKAMNEAAVAYEYVAYQACAKPFLLDVLRVAYGAYVIALKIGKAMVAITVAAGQAVLKVPDFLSTLWDVAVWGGAGVGILWLASKLPRRGA